MTIKIGKKNKSSSNYNFFELDNNNKYDFLRFRAEADSEALKKISDKKIYLKNLPTKPTLKALYNISEKIS